MQQFCDSVVISTVLKKKIHRKSWIQRISPGMTTHFGKFLHARHDLGIAVFFQELKDSVQPQTRIWVSAQQPSALQKDGRSDSTTPSIHIPGIFQWAIAALSGSLHKSWLLLPSLSSRTLLHLCRLQLVIPQFEITALLQVPCVKSSLARVDL